MEIIKEQSIIITINQVMGKLSKTGLAKDNKNQFQGFNYRGIDDLYNILSPILVEFGLVIMPVRIENKNIRIGTDSKGKQSENISAEIVYKFMHIHNEQSIEAVICTESTDNGDKAAFQMMSMAYKYMAIQSLAIPIVGNEDGDSKSPEVPKPTVPELPNEQPTEELITEEQRNQLRALVTSLPDSHQKVVNKMLMDDNTTSAKAQDIIFKAKQFINKGK